MKRHFLIASVIFVFTLLSLTPAFAETNVYHIRSLDSFSFQKRTVDNWYTHYLKTHYERAEEEHASLVILEIDTPGGLVSAMFDIKEVILDSPIDTAVFVNKRALSAGAFIALSAKYIFMAEGATIGAATPVIPSVSTNSGVGFEKASEKQVSAMRAEIRSLAEKYDRPPRVAEAMVDESISLTKAKDGIDCPKGTLLTLTIAEALQTGLITAKANSTEEILSALEMEHAQLISPRVHFSDVILRFLTNPFILALFIIAGIIGAYIEIKTPGFGIGGSIAILAFTSYFIVQLLVGGASWIAPAIFIIGIVLILVEAFVIPGFGVAGIMGILSLGLGVMLGFGVGRLEEGVVVLFVAAIASTILIIILARFLPESNLFQRIELRAQLDNYHVSENYDTLKGKEGVVLKTLRPAGIVEIDDEEYDAISRGTYIDKGVRVHVVKVEGNRIVVSETEAPRA